MDAMTRLARRGPGGHRRGDPRRLPPARRARGRLLRAGERRVGRRAARRTAPTARERIVCVLTGHGLKDPQTALDQAGAVVPCEPSSARVERGGRRASADVQRRRLVRVPASSANLGPGFDASPRRSRCTSSSRWSRAGRFAVETDARDRRATGATSRCAASSACTRPTASRSGSAREIPLSGGLGTSAAAYVAGPDGRRPPVRARRRPARARDGARGPSRQRRRRAARRLRRSAPTAARRASSRRRARGAGSSCPHEAVRTTQARAALPRRGADRPTRSSTSPTARCSMLGLATRRLGPRRARPRRPPAPAPPRAPVPALDRARCGARASSARSARRSPAPARPCSSGCALRADRRRRRGAAPRGRRLGDAPARAVRAAGRRRARAVAADLRASCARYARAARAPVAGPRRLEQLARRARGSRRRGRAGGRGSTIARSADSA